MHEQGGPAQPSRARYPEPVRAYAAMNTVRALERFAFAALSTSQLADSLQVSARTARRLIQRVELEGFVTQESGYRGRYHATRRLAVLGRQALDQTPLVRAATARVAQLAEDTRCLAQLWIRGYDELVVCAVRADGRTGYPAVSVLCDVAPAFSSAAGTVLLPDRAHQWSSCYGQHDEEPTFAAAVVERGHVVAALGVTGDRALAATAVVVTATARLSTDLGSR
jgi:DNA-binding IclR family transcriptional regulator